MTKNLLFLLPFVAFGCNAPTTHSADTAPATVVPIPARTTTYTTSSEDHPAGGRMPYDFSRPAATYPMPAELAELSGIALAGPHRITGIEDETGNLYEYDLAAKQVAQVVPFADNGDYEDVARVGNDWFVLRSDGTLFQYTGTTTRQHHTGLTFDNEPEGLTYDTAAQRLLVACKGQPGAGLGSSQRAIYRLQPNTYHIEDAPAYTLDEAAVAASIPKVASAETAGKKGKKGKKKGDLKRFSPSAVAVHPVTHHVFVLSARQNGIVELDKAGKLLAVQPLSTKLFPQPEGLAFASNGDLYVATEAGSKSGQAAIHLFRMRGW